LPTGDFPLIQFHPPLIFFPADAPIPVEVNRRLNSPIAERNRFGFLLFEVLLFIGEGIQTQR
jgi:hypothetical protein